MDLTQAKAKAKLWTRRIAIAGVLGVVLFCVLYMTFVLEFSYSKGERTGFVQKLSKKGWICKTEEGELAMVNMAGQQAEIFDFTVRDDAVAKQIESLAGHRLVIEYEEHRGIPTTCFGDTRYFITSVHEAK